MDTDPDSWKEEYQGAALTPTWDSELTSVAFILSEGNRKIRRNGGEGFFPKAISSRPLNMRHYRLEFM